MLIIPELFKSSSTDGHLKIGCGGLVEVNLDAGLIPYGRVNEIVRTQVLTCSETGSVIWKTIVIRSPEKVGANIAVHRIIGDGT